MDYQRACKIHPGQSYQGVGRCAWRTPYGNMQPQITRMPEADDYPADDCCEHLAIVTSPVQCWQNLYLACEALSMGTLFRDLNLPLVGCNGAAYRRM